MGEGNSTKSSLIQVRSFISQKSKHCRFYKFLTRFISPDAVWSETVERGRVAPSALSRPTQHATAYCVGRRCCSICARERSGKITGRGM